MATTCRSIKLVRVKAVPELIPREISPGLKAIGAVFSGAKTTTGQIEPYTRWWSVQNQADLHADGPLLVAIGDSICIGIGASHPSKSLAGQVSKQLSERDGVKWRVINLSIPGARIEDALNRQLPIFNQLPQSDVVLACVGSNDILWTPSRHSLRAELRRLSGELPSTTVFGPVAGASARARSANRALREAARANGQKVAEIWDIDGPRMRDRMAADRFHPNDLGYELMANSVLASL